MNQVIDFIFSVLGISNPIGPWYNFWSGFGSDLAIFASVFAVSYNTFRKHNCHVKGCWRIGLHPVRGTDHIVCRKHHPNDSPSASDVIDDYQKERQVNG